MKGLYSCDIMCKLVNFMNKLFWNSVFASRMLAGIWSAYLDLTAHNKLRVWYENSWLQSQKLQLPACVHSLLSSATVFANTDFSPNNLQRKQYTLCTSYAEVLVECAQTVNTAFTTHSETKNNFQFVTQLNCLRFINIHWGYFKQWEASTTVSAQFKKSPEYCIWFNSTFCTFFISPRIL